MTITVGLENQHYFSEKWEMYRRWTLNKEEKKNFVKSLLYIINTENILKVV